MPSRPHLLSAAVLASALTAASVWHNHAETGRGTDFLTASSGQSPSGTSPETSARPAGLTGKGMPSRFSQESESAPHGHGYGSGRSSRTGARPPAETPYGRALPGTTSGGRGLFAPPASRNSLGSGAQVSEAELQWRAAQVEQEANHDLKRLVKLLDLDEDQQDRIFQTLASRSPEWHPLMRTITVSPDFPSDHSAGGDPVAITLPPPSGNGPDEPLASSGITSTNPAPPGQPASGNGDLALKEPETPLTEALAADLTPEQKAALAEEEMDREEWWESIIPRLLPGEEELESDPDTGSDGAYAAPPDAGASPGSSSTGTTGDLGSPPSPAAAQ